MCLGRSTFHPLEKTISANTSPDLSWIEMTKLVPSLLTRFDIELANADREPDQHCWYFQNSVSISGYLLLTCGRWFVKQAGLDMHFRPKVGRTIA
jgi:hypothetical protein